MELRQLRYFLAVAEELNFTAAARKQFVSQPPLSRQIKMLEEEIGASLFYRDKRHVKLTQVGEVLAEKVRKILLHIDALPVIAKQTTDGITGLMRLGFISSAMDSLLPEAVTTFVHKYPEINLELVPGGTGTQLRRIKDGQIDIAVLQLFNSETIELKEPGLKAELFYQEPYILAIPKGHTLEISKKVQIADLLNEPLIVWPKDSHPILYETIVEAFTQKGLKPKIVQQILGKTNVLSLVAAGLGIAFVPASSSKTQRTDIVFLPLKDYMIDVKLFLVYKKKSFPKIVQTFIKHVLKTCSNQKME